MSKASLTDRVQTLELAVQVLLARASFNDQKEHLTSPIRARREGAESAREKYKQSLEVFNEGTLG